MKIQNINNYINYNGNTKPVKREEEAIKNKNYDVIEINKNNKTKVQEKVDYEKIKSNIVQDVKKETSDEKIERIKESVNNNTYQIDVDEIVKRLLDK